MILMEINHHYGQGIVTPHASFLALRFAPDAAIANLMKLQADFKVYSWGGFYDAVNVRNATSRRATWPWTRA